MRIELNTGRNWSLEGSHIFGMKYIYGTKITVPPCSLQLEALPDLLSSSEQTSPQISQPSPALGQWRDTRGPDCASELPS